MSNEVAPTRNLDINQQLPAEWANKMAAYAKQGVAAERTSGNMFSSRNGVLTFAGVAIPNNKMEVVVIAGMHERVYYSKPYQQDAPISPSCYAFSFTGEDMAPHPEAETPINPTCKGCKFDAWKSDPVRGKGKACKEQRRLALMPAAALDSGPDAVMKATVGYLRIPVTSTNAYSEHVKHIGMRGLAVWGAISEVTLRPDPKNMWAFSFVMVAPITQGELLAALEKRHLGELETMAFPYPKPDPTPAAPANRKF